jgi:hypothetical protein
MLSTRSAGAHGIGADVRFLDVNLDAVVYNRENRYA